MTQPTLFEAVPDTVLVANGLALCLLCTASYPQPGDAVTDTERWAAWHASVPHTVSCGGLLLTGGQA